MQLEVEAKNVQIHFEMFKKALILIALNAVLLTVNCATLCSYSDLFHISLNLTETLRSKGIQVIPPVQLQGPKVQKRSTILPRQNLMFKSRVKV